MAGTTVIVNVWTACGTGSVGPSPFAVMVAVMLPVFELDQTSKVTIVPDVLRLIVGPQPDRLSSYLNAVPSGSLKY